MNAQNSNTQPTPSVQYFTISEAEHGQRLDNFLLTRLKGVPRTHVYKLIRTDEVRVNKKRVKAEYRLVAGDSVRVAPVRMAQAKPGLALLPQQSAALSQAVLYEDDDLLVLNKPAGWAVHGGSGIQLGIIEAVRQWREHAKRWELVHRLDRDTSGCLIIAKKPSIMKAMQAEWDQFQKRYVALVCGQWSAKDKFVDAPLLKNVLLSGERMVKVSAEGKSALSEFSVRQQWPGVTLVSVRLHTGRTHQIRVHAQWKKHPLLGDDKYATESCLQLAKSLGVKRLMLHAAQLRFNHPRTQAVIQVEAEIPADMQQILTKLG